MSYQNTSFWKRTLGLNNKIVEPFRLSYEKARDNATFLLGKIRTDFPNLTVHDITHVDSLWNVADTIIGKDYDINPLEGYVLGIAFLIHDATLSYETIGGIDKLRKTIEWQDAYADGPGDMDIDEFKKVCDFEAIRLLHAKKAESILGEVFRRDNGTTFYIINEDITVYNNDIPVLISQDTFNETIGKVAASHHWNIDEVESKLSDQIDPPYGVPNEWTINEQKLACILRCADAGHIDNGRAPDSIYRSLVVNGVSRQHWEAQRKLGQVREDGTDGTKLRITSTKSFEKQDFAAWNVAYDAVRLFDEELKKSNELLKSFGLSFPHLGVAGADSKEALSKYIKTKGWKPCSIGVHTSNVKALIENLGGSKLYGEENKLLVVLRELIQNARDAIQARRKLDDDFGEGRIIIRQLDEDGRHWIEVEDNGVGMSLDCIKNHLLDFGNSYWTSSLAKYENPGLRSRCFKSVGKFGIGFYSIFMVAKSVEVITRRYNKGEDAIKIEFPSGLTLSPIMSDAKQSTNVSTVIRFELKDDIRLEFFVGDYLDFIITLSKALKIVVAGLDTDVYFESIGQSYLIHQNVKSATFNKAEWLYALLIHTYIPDGIDEVASKLEAIIDERNEIRGWVLPHEWALKYFGPYMLSEMQPSITTIGGLSTSINDLTGNYDYKYTGYVGYIDGIEDNINRNSMAFDEPLRKCLKKWIKQKYNENYDNILVSKDLAVGYNKQIRYFGAGNEIVDDNIRRIYVSQQSEIVKGTMKGLMKIHWLLFAGVDENAGQLRTHDIGFYHNETNKEMKGLKLDKLDNALSIIEELPEDSCNNIILKYLQIMIIHPFTDGNERAGRIWVNLVLNHLIGKMIDWRNVDKKVMNELLFSKMPNSERLSEILSNERCEDACNYLRQFLSPTYLAEITASSKENN
ncbi:MAG: Fic family protein [Bacteroidales bacterium]|nr:Fic family protein [Bacteroidales bacterium]